VRASARSTVGTPKAIPATAASRDTAEVFAIAASNKQVAIGKTNGSLTIVGGDTAGRSACFPSKFGDSFGNTLKNNAELKSNSDAFRCIIGRTIEKFKFTGS
jgi:hypothetical protein